MAGVINRNYYDAAEKGRVDRDMAVNRQAHNALSQQAVQQGEVLNQLRSNPQATPEQYARAGRSDVANALTNQANSAANAQSEQRKQFATQMMQVAQYGLQSPTPKAFIEKTAPQLVEQYGPGWATATDDQIKASLQEAVGIFGPMAGVGPPQPKERGLINTVGPDGRPVRGEDVPGAPVFVPPKSNGISVTGPDGTEIQIGGDGVPNYGGGVGMGKATRTNLEKAFTDSQGNAFALREQLAKYRDEFSTLGGRAKAMIAGAKDYAGMENAPQQTQFLSDFTSWKADTNALLSQYLNQLSGAAISDTELVRLKGGFPNADDSPTQYKAKAEATMRRFALVQARAAYLLSVGSQKLDSVSLDGMSNIIAMEANKLAKSLESGGMAPEQAQQQAIVKTRQRFGMD